MNALKKHIYKIITRNNKKAQDSDQVMLKAQISDIYNDYMSSSIGVRTTVFNKSINLRPIPKQSVKPVYAIISTARKEIKKLINYRNRLHELNSLTRERIAQSARKLGIKRGTTEQNVKKLIEHQISKTKYHKPDNYHPF